MKLNMSIADRVLRALLVVVLAILYYLHILPVAAGIFLLVGGLIFLATSLTGFCPIYAITGLRTLSKKK